MLPRLDARAHLESDTLFYIFIDAAHIIGRQDEATLVMFELIKYYKGSTRLFDYTMTMYGIHSH